MNSTVIAEEPELATFVQVWRVASVQHQHHLLEVMHSRVALLTRQPGFVSMTLHASGDGARVAVYAQWESEDMLSAAISLPEAKRAHEEMEEWGTSDGTVYRVDSVFLPYSQQAT